MQTKHKGGIKAIAVIILVLLLGYLLFVSAATEFFYLDVNHIERTRLGQVDYGAKGVGNTIYYYLEDTNIVPEEADTLLFGECYHSDNVLVYSNEYFSADTVICSSSIDEQRDYNRYWAVRIVGGDVTEAWYSKKKLNESDLRPYTDKERRDKMTFIAPLLSPARFHKYGWVDDGEIIGYASWETEKTEE